MAPISGSFTAGVPSTAAQGVAPGGIRAPSPGLAGPAGVRPLAGNPVAAGIPRPGMPGPTGVPMAPMGQSYPAGVHAPTYPTAVPGTAFPAGYAPGAPMAYNPAAYNPAAYLPLNTGPPQFQLPSQGANDIQLEIVLRSNRSLYWLGRRSSHRLEFNCLLQPPDGGSLRHTSSDRYGIPGQHIPFQCIETRLRGVGPRVSVGARLT